LSLINANENSSEKTSNFKVFSLFSTFFGKKLKLMKNVPIIRGRRKYVMDAKERDLLINEY